MKSTWTPTLCVKQAVAICGSLSNPSKMPGHGYALPAYRCRIGRLLQLIPKAICHYCYALRGRYLFPVVRAAMEKRFSSLSDPRWADAISTLIYRSGDRYFRWHDSGDLQSIEHLRKIVAVCKNLPRVKFWLPTREYQTVEAYRRMGGRIPSNLCIRLSAHLINGKLPLGYWTTGEHRLVSQKSDYSQWSLLPGGSPGQHLRPVPCLLEPDGQGRRVSPEVIITGVRDARKPAATHPHSKGDSSCPRT